ncbi:MAG: hypothetical protein IT368_16115 [Candidatus Hydrogenedentes bacterium]|nr:hypothetical protein [Candidatus Hydrogenedentota bacterium]
MSFWRSILVLGLLTVAACLPVAAEVLEAPPFRIEFHTRDADLATRSLQVLEEARREFAPRLPAGDEPIRIVIAHTMNEFMSHARVFGQMNVSGIAKPDESLIVVKAPHLRRLGEDYRGTLRHELVHVLLHRNSNPAYLPRWLNEGLSMSLANEYYWQSVIELAQMYASRRIIEYKDLDQAFYAPGTEMKFGDAYAQALSMTRWMRDEFGEEVFWSMIADTRNVPFAEALQKHTGMNVREFWEAYHGSLWKLALIGIFTSGSLFTPAAILAIIAYLRKRAQNQRTLEQWAVEEGEEDLILSWDDVAEGPYDWEEDEEDESWR